MSRLAQALKRLTLGQGIILTVVVVIGLLLGGFLVPALVFALMGVLRS